MSSAEEEKKYDSTTHHFQVDLRGVIDILANHLYSTPNVFIRELLQNGCDAIRMRQRDVDPSHEGAISLEVIPGKDGRRPTLVVTDTGIGLTEEEVHTFLSTVGRSSKRDDLFQSSSDFIGQFGIGLLSCFTVSEEITLLTRSARSPEKGVSKWTAFADGTYQLETSDIDISPGATVYLRARSGCDDLFTRETVQSLAREWGSLLPHDIEISGGEAESSRITLGDHPLLEKSAFNYEKAMDFGGDMFPQEGELFDVVPISSEVGGVTGLAYILGRSSPRGQSQKHRVYLKGMLLTENNETLLPEWAFFARAVINAQSLRPTASREDLYNDEILEAVRDEIGRSLKHYLLDLSHSNPDKLRRLIRLHWLSFKALAAEDDEFFQTIIKWLPFETSLGEMTLPQIREASRGNSIRYLSRDEEFRQIKSVASAQKICVINSSYVYDESLLERVNSLTDLNVEKLDPREITHSFEDLTEDEQAEVFDFIRKADEVLDQFSCQAEVRRFSPEEVPVFFVSNEAAGFMKAIEKSKDGGLSDPMMDSFLDALSGEAMKQAYTSLCFNYRHPQIERLTRVVDFDVLENSVKMLYVQALLLGQQPLSTRELNLLTDGISIFLDWGLSQGGNES